MEKTDSFGKTGINQKYVSHPPLLLLGACTQLTSKPPEHTVTGATPARGAPQPWESAQGASPRRPRGGGTPTSKLLPEAEK